MKKINWVPEKSIYEKSVTRLLSASIESNQFTNGGPNVARLEKYIAEILKINTDHKSVVCVCNGSSAIQVLCSAIEYVEGAKKWATQSFTFPPSAQSSLKDCVILDIDNGGGLDLQKVPTDIEGIIVTNIFGNVVDISKYVDYADKNDIFLVFDNAATPLTSYKGKNCCEYGHGCIISFHHTKPIGFGEGGAIIIDKKYERAVRRLINFGLDNEHPEVEWHPKASNHKMSDISAVYILQYLENIDAIVEIHKSLYSYMTSKLTDLGGVELYPSFGSGIPFVSCFSLLFDDYDDEKRKRLLEGGVFCRKYYKPLKPTPKSMELYESILCIPCTKDMTLEDVDRICEILK